MSYAGAKGKAGGGSLKPPPRTPPPALSDDEKAAIAERVRLIKAHLPAAMDFVKELHEEGMVDGLRCIVSVTVFEGGDHGSDG